MDSALVARPPFYHIPILFSFQSEELSVWRNIHCVECGGMVMPAKDRVAMVSDAVGGSVGTMCSRHSCKQRYRIEVKE